MFADSSLRDDQALVAMADDLRRSKAARNDLAKENACVAPLASMVAPNLVLF
jgi:hypothetical protein